MAAVEAEVQFGAAVPGSHPAPASLSPMVEREQKPERHLSGETINNRGATTVTHNPVLDTGRRFTEAASGSEKTGAAPFPAPLPRTNG